MAEMLRLDQNAIVVLLVLALGFLGFRRGVRSEGITLGGVMAATGIFTQDAMRLQLVSIINRTPRVIEMLLASEDGTSVSNLGTMRPLNSADDRLLFYVMFYLAVVGVFYWVGSSFGGLALIRAHRFLGGLVGAVSGFLISYATVTFGQDYLGRHPSPEPVSITVPGPGLAPTLSGGSLAQYLPLVFMVALFFAIIFTLTGARRAKH